MLDSHDTQAALNITKSSGAGTADLWHQTLLHIAAAAGSKDIVQALLQKGANPDAQDTSGIRPLLSAVSGKKRLADEVCRDIVRILLEAGAEVDAVEPHGRTALHHAVIFTFEETAKILLQYGANPLIISVGDGETPESLARDIGGPIAELLNNPPPPTERKSNPAASQTQLFAPRPDTKRREICEHFQGLIWSPTEGDSKPRVWDLIYDVATSVEVIKKLAESPSRWIHVPLNDVSLHMRRE